MCSDGEEEVLEAFLSEQAPEFKIGLSLLTAGVITSGALALCWLTGSDPWGKVVRQAAYGFAYRLSLAIHAVPCKGVAPQVQRAQALYQLLSLSCQYLAGC